MGVNLLTEAIGGYVDAEMSIAVRETDWNETAVLRIVVRQPQPQMDWHQDEPPQLLPDIDVYRYEDEAPPAEEHADGEHRIEVFTITKPLLESDSRLQEYL